MVTAAAAKKWKAEDLVKKVFDMDPRINFCGVVNEDGELSAGGMRPGVSRLEPKDQTPLIVLRTAVGSKAMQASDKHLSDAKYGIIYRERITQMVFSLPGRQELQVAADASLPLDRAKLIEKLLVKSVSPKYYV